MFPSTEFLAVKISIVRKWTEPFGGMVVEFRSPPIDVCLSGCKATRLHVRSATKTAELTMFQADETASVFRPMTLGYQQVTAGPVGKLGSCILYFIHVSGQTARPVYG